MEYQISYVSPQGNAQNLAFSLKRLLPSLTPLIDLNKQTLNKASTHLVGFEFPGTSLTEIPNTIQKVLSEMGAAEVLVFATTPLVIDKEMYAKAEASVLSCLPSNCKYRGFFLCQGEASATLIQDLSIALPKDPANKELRNCLKMCRSSKLHPNRQDTRMACRFAAEALRLEYYR